MIIFHLDENGDDKNENVLPVHKVGDHNNDYRDLSALLIALLVLPHPSESFLIECLIFASFLLTPIFSISNCKSYNSLLN